MDVAPPQTGGAQRSLTNSITSGKKTTFAENSGARGNLLYTLDTLAVRSIDPEAHDSQAGFGRVSAKVSATAFGRFT